MCGMTNNPNFKTNNERGASRLQPKTRPYSTLFESGD